MTIELIVSGSEPIDQLLASRTEFWRTTGLPVGGSEPSRIAVRECTFPARPADALAYLRRRRHILLVMLTTLQFRYPGKAGPDLITELRRWLGGWPGIGRNIDVNDTLIGSWRARGWRLQDRRSRVSPYPGTPQKSSFRG